MARKRLPDWAAAIILLIILMTLFPIAAQRLFQSILLGIVIGIAIAIVIIGVWWYLENR